MPSSRSVASFLLRLLGRVSASRPDTAPTAQRPFLTARDAAPGATGVGRTTEVDPTRVRGVHLGYAPTADGDPDPGEIVWTWVPYEEDDGRGKDRPVLVLAVEKAGTVLAVRLSSKQHDDYLPIGTGAWDPEGRPSYVDPERVFRVHPAGMRREGAALDRSHFDSVAKSVSARYGWR
ncbi:type II toxin-antitoxin system PemK/MazF family toxin [Rathayibacter sp. VKM Ac-2803]|uniref:type II toxin-antitoxin system PemK/MazF family toxin n=1 Tax=unclassified Rathayibacter TaxID=2609250 RepID=UPI00135698AB|nr:MULTISPECIES: type II toxin-antitoxin system PemK/MazF family toxin [unclassified Rathayibacter]MWV49936.1 type II toxin-antitoxin system PemK/MazF family toxin [Rathayibacter sp. VKM Ac-2803]MWV58068.1 type II toxin-antitoxin system PemK/MazF family toxin [Rathayibacter sp. VKM Ac-2754]